MRKRLLLALAIYFTIGLAIALVKMPGTFTCPGYHGPSGFTTRHESCRPISTASERFWFIGKVAPTWPVLVMDEGIGPRLRGPTGEPLSGLASDRHP